MPRISNAHHAEQHRKCLLAANAALVDGDLREAAAWALKSISHATSAPARSQTQSILSSILHIPC